MAITRQDIASYYDRQQGVYDRWWSSTALHYGLWYEDTKTLAEAFTNTDKAVIDVLGIGPGDRVLDAGWRRPRAPPSKASPCRRCS